MKHGIAAWVGLGTCMIRPLDFHVLADGPVRKRTSRMLLSLQLSLSNLSRRETNELSCIQLSVSQFSRQYCVNIQSREKSDDKKYPQFKQNARTLLDFNLCLFPPDPGFVFSCRKEHHCLTFLHRPRFLIACCRNACRRRTSYNRPSYLCATFISQCPHH